MLSLLLLNLLCLLFSLFFCLFFHMGIMKRLHFFRMFFLQCGLLGMKFSDARFGICRLGETNA